MNITPFTILIIIALLLAVASMIVPRYPLLSVAVVLLAVALLMGPR